MINSLIFNNRILIVFVYPFVLGVLTVFSFQPFNYTFINFLILPALFLITTFVNKKSKNIYRKKPYLTNLFFVGYFFGIGFFLTGTYWISYSLTFDESFKFLIPFTIVLLPLFLGLFFGIATFIAGPLIKNNFISILIFCVSLSSMDYLRSKILTGFPWNLWSYSWSWFPEVIQSLNLMGLFAHNLVSITIFCCPILLMINNKKKIFFGFLLLLYYFLLIIFMDHKI